MFGNSLNTTTAAAGAGSGFSFGSSQPTNTLAKTTPGPSGFSFGNTLTGGSSVAATPAPGGFTLGAQPTLPAAAPASTGFTLGNTPAAGTGLGTGFSQPSALDSSSIAQKAVRFDMGTSTTQATASPFSLGGLAAAQASTPASSGFSFGTPTATTSTLAGLLTGTKPALSLGTTATVPATAAPSLGFPSSFAGNTGSLATTSTGFGTAPFGLGTGGLGSTTTTSNIFGTTVTSSTVAPGLGGVDPKLASSNLSGSGASSKKCDGRALKENPVDPVLLNTIEEFTKHLKNQKNIRENISRMSLKPLLKVKEEIKNLQQQLMLVSSGLQKNSTAIEKLKREASQELKNAEMAQRTKEMPTGLQFENTAPTEYFHRLTEGFEMQMILYRQQILDTENHLISLNQSAMLTPQELSQMFAKLNAGFTALASQLQVVHEEVRDQKEKYLEFRRLYHGDTKDIFARRKKVQESMTKCIPSTVGPTPFLTVGGIGTMASSLPSSLLTQKVAVSSAVTGFATPQQGFGQTTANTGSLFGGTATPCTVANFGGLSTAGGTGSFGGGGGGSIFGCTGSTATAQALPFNTPTTTTTTPKSFGSKRGKNA